MIELKENDEYPKDAVLVVNKGNKRMAYFEDDDLIKNQHLEGAREIKLEQIEHHYKASLKSGFVSGGDTYSSDSEDLQDLVNAVTTGINQEFKTIDGVIHSYTPAQIKKVLIDVTAAKLQLVKDRDFKKNAILNAITLEELNSIKI